MRPTQALIHLDRFQHNLDLIRSLTSSSTKICAAVKAQAYGHGAPEVARRLKADGVEALGVATPEEGTQLRQSGVEGPILLFGAVNPDQMGEVVDADLEPFVFDEPRIREYARISRERRKTLRVHLKVDTGMGRLGCAPEDAARLARRIVHEQGLELEGLCTHFASSDGPGPVTVAIQLSRFEIARKALSSEGLRPRLVHAANSGAVLDWPESHFDMIRPGIVLYGYPAPSQRRPDPGFLPVLEWISEVVYVKEAPKGTTLSYGSRYTTSEKTKIATIPVGYADGWRRSFSNRADILVGTQIARVSGTVCMDQFLVDLGPDSPVREGDPVVLLGFRNPSAASPLDARGLAEIDGTIPYEILCGIGTRVPRVYLD